MNDSGWFLKAEGTPVKGSVATPTQQADQRFDKDAMLKMIRESQERSQEEVVIPCTQTAHPRYLDLYVCGYISLSAACT